MSLEDMRDKEKKALAIFEKRIDEVEQAAYLWCAEKLERTVRGLNSIRPMMRAAISLAQHARDIREKGNLPEQDPKLARDADPTRPV